MKKRFNTQKRTRTKDAGSAFERRCVMGNDFKEMLNEQLKNPGFKKEYDALEAEFSIIQAMLDARKAFG